MDLHVAMSRLSESASLSDQARQLPHSLSRRSLKALESAQGLAEVNNEGFDLVLGDQQEELTEKAVLVIRRVMDKLTGLDFNNPGNLQALGLFASQHAAALDVPEQVDKLVRQATANENLCLSYFGWCPFW